ncbi:MAG: hypothetical protein EOO92_25455 [Pedobacter sp.]|nr:MAG: hypothetical protein EOO92_25455 [Pedobacter sp.]
MKSLKTNYFFILFTLFLLCSCQKEESLENGNLPGVSANPSNPSNTQGDSIYLSKMYRLETTNGVTDTSISIKLTYDAQKRCKDIGTYFRNGSQLQLSELGTCYYNGADTLPYKIEFKYWDNGIPEAEVDEKFITYDNVGRKVRDSSIGRTGTTVGSKTITTFTYNNDKMYGTTEYTDYNFSSQSYKNKDTATLVNGNIVSNKKYEYNGTTYVYATESNLTYDNFYSPLTLPAFYAALWDYPSGDTYDYLNPSRNNMLTHTERMFSPVAGFSSATFSYQYNARRFATRSTDSDGEILYFAYTNL